MNKSKTKGKLVFTKYYSAKGMLTFSVLWKGGNNGGGGGLVHITDYNEHSLSFIIQN